MILGKNIHYGYGKEPIFNGADFYVGKNQKVGLVGANGAGKSTLFKLISGDDTPEDGKLTIEGTVLSVPQEVKYDAEMESSKSIREYLTKSTFAKASVDKEDYELSRILAKLELEQFDLDSPPLNMSGGQKTKLAIARALVREPDILLLDEPTNFLDTAGKEWVMNFLGRYPKTLIVISHDLGLLDSKIDKILEVNLQSRKIDEYAGSYSSYLKLKGDKEALLVRQIHVQERHIAQMKKGWLKMSHVKSEKGVRQKLQLEKRISKMEESLPEMPLEAKKIKISLPEPTWVGSVPLIAEKISKSYGTKTVLKAIDFDIKRGERIALMGQNGAGKSTLIKILMGAIEPDEGEVLRDDKLDIGYYSQEFEVFDMEQSLLEAMKERCSLPEQTLRGHLGRFLFSGDKVFQKIKSLSGGEKTRLAIGALLVQKHNLLILDEPTTYLDVLSQRLILEALKTYKGAMLVVSHTPEFIEGLKPERKLLLPENRWVVSS